MNVRNVHERVLRRTTADAVGRLVDELASPIDPLWPHDRWPRMSFDRPLSAGATGGHGPIRYFVEAYEPRRSVVFRFTAPRGFEGTHSFHVRTAGADAVCLEHVLEMKTRGFAMVSWPVVFQPLHDALIEDSLDRAEHAVRGAVATEARWSSWVRVLRWLLRA